MPYVLAVAVIAMQLYADLCRDLCTISDPFKVLCSFCKRDILPRLCVTEGIVQHIHGHL